MSMKKTLLIPPIIMDIILLPAIMFSLFPYVLEAIFQTPILKPFVIFGIMILTIFTYLKPWFWLSITIIYYIICLIYAIKKFESVKLFIVLLTVFCLISIYGNITSYEFIDTIINF